MQTSPIVSDNESLLKGLKHPLEFSQFISWLALPESLRNPQNQKDLAEKFGVGEDTLSDWKKRNGFWNEVKTQHKDFGKARTADVLEGLYHKAKKGTAPEVRLWLQYFEGFSERAELDTEIKQVVIVRGESDLTSQPE